MVEQASSLVVTSKTLPISFKLIFEVLSNLFEGHASLILSSIKKIVVIKEDSPYFSTMGITKEGTLFISQTFWDTHMQDSDALATVLMHELMHVIGGDVVTGFKTKEEDPDYELRNQADLIAMDSRINAYICANRKEINPSVFFKSFYNAEAIENDFLTKLLRPDSIFDHSSDQRKLKKFYDTFYETSEFCNHQDLSNFVFEILKQRQKDSPQQKQKLILLGSHGEDGKELSDVDLENCQVEVIEENSDSEDSAADRDQLDEDIKEAILEQVSSELGYSKESGYSSHAAQSILDMSGRISQKLSLVKFKNMLSDSVFSNVKAQARKRVAKYSYSPLLPNNPSSMDLILMSAGIPPLLWRSKKYTTVYDKQLLPIYLDVSGSTYSYLPDIIKMIVNASKEIDSVWGFSNKIAKHTIDQLKEGKINSTGGTDFNCIIEHAIENNFKHIVVITDGYAGVPRRFVSNIDQKVPEISTVATVIFGGGTVNSYFSQAYQKTYDLQEVIN